jgi:hypothetical protein
MVKYQLVKADFRKFYYKFLDRTQTKPFTTPFRKLIEVMPQEALMVLNRCMKVRGVEFAKCARQDLDVKELEIQCKISWISDDYRILKWFNQGVKKSAENNSASLMDVILQPNYTSEIVITVRPYSENSKVLYTNNPLILRRAHILLMKNKQKETERKGEHVHFRSVAKTLKNIKPKF